MLLALVVFLIFISVYSFVWQIFGDRKARLSFGGAGSALPVAREAPEQFKEQEKLLRNVLKPFNFLAGLKAIRSLIRPALSGRLLMAGAPLTAIEFAIFKVLSIVICVILGSIIFRNDKLLSIAVGLVCGFLFPECWLSMRIKRRHQEIRRDLPSVIDLLNLCVGSGLDFMLAVDRVIKNFKKCPLTQELSEVWRENRMGSSRRDALQHLSRRINLPELSSFVRTLLQADRMGAPMSDALKIQAEELRLRRFLQGEEAALKAPIKLLFPLIFFILPAVMVIVAGPIILQFMQGGGLKF